MSVSCHRYIVVVPSLYTSVGNAMYIHAQSCYPILSYPSCPSYLCPKSQSTPRKYSNQNSRQKNEIPQKRESRLYQTPFPSPKKARQQTRPETEPKYIMSCHNLYVLFFCVFIFVNNCQHPLEGDVFDPEFPALPSSLALFFSGGASSFMHAFSRMFVHFPLVPAWLCFKC